MSKEMKLIMESWRTNVLSETEEMLTVGDLRNSLQSAVRAKQKGIATDQLKDIGVNMLVDLVPGAATLKSVGEFFLNIYKMPDGKKTNTALDALNIDDDVSAIVDDTIENDFLKEFLKILKDLPDTQPLEGVDMTQELSDFIAGKFNQTKVEK